ncbi:hypothetical protein Tco_1371864 [Tanacetum coccineum]
MDDDKEKEELKQCFEIVPDDGDDVTIDVTPLSVKIPINFNREDLEVLWRIVKARFKKTKPVDYMDTFLLLTLKTMFKHHVEDKVWKRQQGLVKVLNWKLFDSCGVHCIGNMDIKFRGGLLGLKDFLVLLKLLLLVMVSTAGEVQGKYSKWLILLVQKLRLLVEVTAAQEIQGQYTKWLILLM